MVRRIQKIAVIGAGLIGAEWAAFFAAKGYGVKIYDADPLACARGMRKAHSYLEFMDAHEFRRKEEETVGEHGKLDPTSPSGQSSLIERHR